MPNETDSLLPRDSQNTYALFRGRVNKIGRGVKDRFNYLSPNKVTATLITGYSLFLLWYVLRPMFGIGGRTGDLPAFTLDCSQLFGADQSMCENQRVMTDNVNGINQDRYDNEQHMVLGLIMALGVTLFLFRKQDIKNYAQDVKLIELKQKFDENTSGDDTILTAADITVSARSVMSAASQV